jgi:hypothetical protein
LLGGPCAHGPQERHSPKDCDGPAPGLINRVAEAARILTSYALANSASDPDGPNGNGTVVSRERPQKSPHLVVHIRKPQRTRRCNLRLLREFNTTDRSGTVNYFFCWLRLVLPALRPLLQAQPASSQEAMQPARPSRAGFFVSCFTFAGARRAPATNALQAGSEPRQRSRRSISPPNLCWRGRSP